MSKQEEELVGRFLADEAMSKAIWSVLIDSFMKKTTVTDVQTLAAQRIAIDLLREGWRELEKHKPLDKKNTNSSGQIGL